MNAAKQIDHDDHRRNMFGIADCPKCKHRKRWPTSPKHGAHPNSILCDDCGRVEAMDEETLIHFGVQPEAK